MALLSPHYISFGSDCSVSYQLRKYHLQGDNLTMPFDWFRMDKISMIVEILDDIFEKDNTTIFNFIEWDILPQSNKFNNNNEDNNEDNNQNLKSLNRLKHRKYGIIAPHEYCNKDINIIDFESKYNRRIDRFIKICKNDSILKIFVRCGNSKDAKKICILDDAIKKYIKNYKLLYINYDEYSHLIPNDNNFNWKRDYIDWFNIFHSC